MQSLFYISSSFKTSGIISLERFIGRRLLSLSSHRSAYKMSTLVKPKVLVPIADGTEEIEAVTVIDTLVRGGSEVTVASVGQKLSVTCSRGVKLLADRLIQDCIEEKWDLIVCPGGMPGATHLSESPALTELLLRQNQQNKLIAAICAAPAVVLAKHGLLNNGKHATCYPAESFKSMIQNYQTDNVVVDGNVITSRGPGTAMEFSLKLVEILFGHEKAMQLRKEMIIH